MTHGRNLSPADELGMIRAEMRRLKAREAELRAQILEIGAPEPGAEWRIEVIEQRRRTFDRTALPPSITEDPRYWKESITKIVKTVPVEDPGGLIDDDDI